ncbi:alanine--tRNA ligase-related protein [Solwaraspora sp. WMMB335]|uniref:alanine--tRNA ligase-related protein n=1 Tax=Solwaraspora sp. WMMB335 TaxID=3404118 RepID=UPI003B924F87
MTARDVVAPAAHDHEAAVAFAEQAVDAFATVGYLPAHGSAVAETDGSTLFVSGGIQAWRRWIGEPGPAARAGLQWCVRMNRLADAGRSGFVTSFCMLTAARRGAVPRHEVLADLFTALGLIGVDVARTAFVIPALDDRCGDPLASEALAKLGVDADRIGYAPRRWAAPFGADGPSGPNLFVLLDRTGHGCGPGCAPGCGCGRYLHFWNCEFLDHRGGTDDGAGRIGAPVVDSAGGLERLWSAVTGEDMFAGPLLRPVLSALAAHLPGDPDRAGAVADHARSLALLLAAGIAPAARGQGHVARRLARRAGWLLIEAGSDPGALRPAVLAAQACNRAVADFGVASATALGWLDAEIGHCREGAAHGALLFHRWTHGRSAGADITRLVFRLRAERGVPLSLLRRWAARDGFTLDEQTLQALLDAERASSRSPALTAQVAARWAARTSQSTTPARR